MYENWHETPLLYWENAMALADLRIYQDATAIAGEIATIVGTWPTFEKQTLGNQIVRAADSVASNIAEGYGRVSTGERLQFFLYADGSCQEVKAQLHLAKDRGLLEERAYIEGSRTITRLSIAVIEFCNAILYADPEYNGRYRDLINRRRAWRNKP
jgi:four helix bundle protein